MGLLGQTKLDTIEVLISKALMDSYINYDEFVSVNNVLREYNKMKEEFKNRENTVEYTIWKQWKCIVQVLRKILQIKTEEEQANKIN